MGKLRLSGEWVLVMLQIKLGSMISKRTWKLEYIIPIGKFHNVSTLLTNPHSSLYGNVTEIFFDLQSPTIRKHFQLKMGTSTLSMLQDVSL